MTIIVRIIFGLLIDRILRVVTLWRLQLACYGFPPQASPCTLSSTYILPLLYSMTHVIDIP